MIIFNDGKTSDAYPYFTGTVCTIHDTEPNTSGFTFDGMDFSDFTTLYRKGDGWYQLSNDGFVCQDETEDVPTKEEIQELFRSIERQNELAAVERVIEAKKTELSASDYIIIKIVEGVDVSQYDVEQIKQDRQRLRDEINELEEKYKSIQADEE